MATLSGSPVAHASVNARIATAQSARDGSFTLNAASAPAGNLDVTVTADGYLPRETMIGWPRTSDLIIDVTSTARPYNGTFYSQLARGALEFPGRNYPLYRWSSQLRFYLQTQDEFGRSLDRSVLDLIERGIRIAVQYYTAGTYQADIVEGPETRSEQTGWVNVEARQDIPEGDYCGLTTSIGSDPATVQLRIDRCGCGSIKIPIAVVIHEVGHAVGMFHVSGKEDVMHSPSEFGCREVIPSPAEQYHAALIYARPRGNVSPDRDPTEFQLGYPATNLPRLPPVP